jgi:hypothetical protein
MCGSLDHTSLYKESTDAAEWTGFNDRARRQPALPSDQWAGGLRRVAGVLAQRVLQLGSN